jgi:ATP-dependent Clp protease adaptor protein ClpS
MREGVREPGSAGKMKLHDVSNHPLEDIPVSNDPASPDTVVTTRTREREQQKIRRIPPYNVILENDDHHSFDFVIEVLRKVLGCSEQRAFLLMDQAHNTGRSIIWTGTREVAELKVEQIRTFHELRESDNRQLGPLSCLIEPAPGG